MPLEWTNLPFFFNVGLDQKSDAKLSQGYGTLENVEWRKDGSLVKRNSYRMLASSSIDADGGESSSAVLDQPRHLITRRDSNGREELVLVTDKTIESYSSAASNFMQRGINHPARLKTEFAGVSSNNKLGQSSVIRNGIRVTTWAEEDGGDATNGYKTTLKVSTQDRNTGAYLLKSANLSLGGNLARAPRS